VTEGATRGASASIVAQGVLLASSRSIENAVEARKLRRVDRILAGLPVGSDTFLPPLELNALLGRDETAPVTGVDKDLDFAEIEARAPAGLTEQVPFGIAGVVWALQHPSQAWRLLLPVLG
jgi:hypothetical protein